MRPAILGAVAARAEVCGLPGGTVLIAPMNAADAADAGEVARRLRQVVRLVRDGIEGSVMLRKHGIKACFRFTLTDLSSALNQVGWATGLLEFVTEPDEFYLHDRSDANCVIALRLGAWQSIEDVTASFAGAVYLLADVATNKLAVKTLKRARGLVASEAVIALEETYEILKRAIAN